jgi:hypothetical protein
MAYPQNHPSPSSTTVLQCTFAVYGRMARVTDSITALAM